MFVTCLDYKIIIFLPLAVPYCLKGHTYVNPHLWDGNYSVSLEKEWLYKLFEILLQRCISSPPVAILSYLYHYRLMNIYLISLAINQQCLVLAQVLATSGIRHSLEPAPVFIDVPLSKVLSVYVSTSLVLAVPVAWRYLLHSLPSVDLVVSDQL